MGQPTDLSSDHSTGIRHSHVCLWWAHSVSTACGGNMGEDNHTWSLAQRPGCRPFKIAHSLTLYLDKRCPVLVTVTVAEAFRNYLWKKQHTISIFIGVFFFFNYERVYMVLNILRMSLSWYQWDELKLGQHCELKECHALKMRSCIYLYS